MNAIRRRRMAGFLALTLTFWCCVGTRAMFKRAPKVDVDRLVKNTEAYIKEHPKEAHGYYVNARLHHLAFDMRTLNLPVYNADSISESQLPQIDERQLRSEKNDKTLKPLEDVDTTAHLKEAFLKYRAALRLKPENALYHLGYACLLERAATEKLELPKDQEPTAEESKTVAALIPNLGDETAEARDAAEREIFALGEKALPELRKHEQDADVEVRARIVRLIRLVPSRLAVEEYRRAYLCSVEEDRELESLPIDGLEAVLSHEAGVAYLRLRQAEGAKDDAGEKDQTFDQQVEKHVKHLKTLQVGAMTPVIFSLEKKDARLAELLEPTHIVRFDLNGDGIAEPRPWVKPETCILVWDPEHAGKIGSGRQLFGNVTWWIFWTDGYHALDALDDNRDGQLSGAELVGLAVWRDANGNGVSDEGEVVPLEDLGIAALSVRETHRDGNAPASREGVRMRDGTTRPSFDWIAPALPEKR